MNVARAAWRNMWRNRGRTVLSGTAILASTVVMCIILSLETAYVDDMKSNVKNHVTGDIRVMDARYAKSERVAPLQFSVENARETAKRLESAPGIALAVPRTETTVAIYRTGDRVPCRMVGVDFARAPLLTGVNDRVVSGHVPGSLSSGILVAKGLADELNLKPGDKITVLARTAISGTNGKTFTVAGIASFADASLSERVFFADWETVADFLRMGDGALQIQVFLSNPKRMDEGLASTGAALGERAQRMQIIPWYKIGGLYGFLEMADIVYAIYGVVFYLLASTVVFNTTMMSVLERKREIGTLAALGMGKGAISRLFLAESALIAILGTVAGLVAGGTLVALWGRAGFDIEAMYGKDMSGTGYSKIVYPALLARQYAQIFVTGVAVSAVACLFPARLAARVEPADALADR